MVKGAKPEAFASKSARGGNASRIPINKSNLSILKSVFVDASNEHNRDDD
jgi:hypothetical protein